jgi:hypothetical protein
MRQLLVPAVIVALAQCLGVSCARGHEKRLEPVYDPVTGKLQLLRYDSKGNGQFDTFRYMDGARVIRVEIDSDGDGKIDRWEHYGPDQKLEKVGFSLQNDGKEDAWAWAGPDGATARVESSPRRDGKVSRIDHYEHGVLVRAEEDSDGDGQIDKWETYDGPRLATVAFDTMHRGVPDRRIVYDADSNARIEVDPQGDGHFVAATAPAADRPRRAAGQQ